MKANYGKILLGTLTSLLCAFITLTAHATNYTLTLDTNGSGTVSRDPTNSSYPSGVTVIITATPTTGWYFAGWTGDTNSQVNPLNVIMNSNMVVTGNFLAYPTYSLTLATNGSGGIGLSPNGGSYQSNITVTATATPAAGWVFAGWSGAASGTANPISFPVNATGTLTGTFAQLPKFDVEPVGVTNKVGSTVSLTSHSVGSTPLGYTWYFSGGTLNGATNATLTWTNATTAETGNYWVVATNNWGSATSAVVSLVVTNPIGATNVVTSPNQGSLQAAIALGGWVGIGFNGTLTLTNTINITSNVVLDGTGVAAVISGGNAVQLFNVAQGANLTISNLTLANGSCLITSGTNGTPANGGAIYNSGTLMLVGCVLTNNSAESLVVGGTACGGAIFNNGGAVSLYQSMIISNTTVGGGAPYSSGTTGTTGTALGGAIYSSNGSTMISGCRLIGNSSTSVCQYWGYGMTMGGAIFQSAGVMTITNSQLSSNQAVGGSGAFYDGSPTPAFPSSPAYGGAVAVTGGSLLIAASQFQVNQSVGGTQIYYGDAGPADGGAIYFTAATGSANTCAFFGNRALAGNYNYEVYGQAGSGGAIYNGGTFTLNNSSIYSNAVLGGISGQYGNIYGGGGLGGGIYNSGRFAATNCTIALNSATGAQAFYHYGTSATSGSAIGGGIFDVGGATFLAMNLTVASNYCSSPAGMESVAGFTAGWQIANYNTNGPFSVHNCLIAYSSNNSCAYGLITDDGYNICSDGSAALYSGSSYNYTDPQLAPLGNYGGPTLCMALLSTSPAIDNGDSNGAPSVDQRGYLRPFGSGVDIGAYEYGAAPSTIPYLSLSMNGNNAMLSFAMFPSNTYLLQWSTNLTTWVNLSTNGPVTTSTSVTQPVSNQSASRGFYRLFVQ